MEDPTDLLFRLPQSLMRSLGIPGLCSMRLSQVDVERNNGNVKNSAWNEAISDINIDILNSVNPGVPINFLDLRNFIDPLPKIAAVDFNLISSIDIYPNLRKIESIFVLPYASHVNCPKIADLSFFKSFLRCLKTSHSSNKRLSVDYYYDWASMILNQKTSNYLPWFWKPVELNCDLYLSRIQKIVKVFNLKFSFFQNFINSTSPILILATELPNGSSFFDKMEYLYKFSDSFKIAINEGRSQIFLKSHRTHPFPRSVLPNTFRGTPVIVADNLSETVIPAELFLNCGKDLLLAAEFGSSIFNFQVKRFIPMPLATDTWTIPSYGLIVERMKEYCDISHEYGLAHSNSKRI